MSDAVLTLARQFHGAYERLAPEFGYETRTETRDFDPASPNGRLMVAVCAEVLDRKDVVSIGQDPDGTPSIDIMLREDCSMSISVTETGLAWAWVSSEASGSGVTKDEALCRVLRAILDIATATPIKDIP